MADVRDADLAKTIGRNITDFEGQKYHDSKPNTAIMVNIMVNKDIKKEADP